jgi:hypothetical protein
MLATGAAPRGHSRWASQLSTWHAVGIRKKRGREEPPVQPSAPTAVENVSGMETLAPEGRGTSEARAGSQEPEPSEDSEEESDSDDSLADLGLDRAERCWLEDS